MLDFTVKIGLVPVRRDRGATTAEGPKPARLANFNPWTAMERAHQAVDYLRENFTDKHVSFVDLSGINYEGVLYNEDDVPKVIDRMAAEKVDAIFLINVNFGNEEVAAMVAKAVGKPVLLWAPLDDFFGEDGSRLTDAQCGVFGMSRQLQRRNVPFTYIKNCRIEDDCFAKGFRDFVSVACMVKNFKDLRVAQVGMRPKPFCSVIVNEGELMQKLGVQIIPVNLANFKQMFDYNLENRKEELAALGEDFTKKFEFDEYSLGVLDRMCCFILTYQDIFEKYNVSAVSAECWTAMGQLVGCSPCASYSPLADLGYIVGCESDMHATITMVLLKCAALGEDLPFLGEFTARHPENPNAELLWHCGPFAWSLHQDDQPTKVSRMRAWLHVKDGHYTISRLDQDNGQYKLLAGEFDGVDGPYTTGTYIWGEFKDLDAWERKLIEGPYIHHMCEISGAYREVFKEFCKYVPNLEFDTAD